MTFWSGHLNTRFLKEDRPYTGPELRPHYLLSEMGLEGSALCAFAGPCEVKTEHLVDWEDRLKSDFIRARRMLHFLGEFFGMNLREGVFLQRLMVSMLEEQLREAGLEKEFRRDGDDLFVSGKKLTVSIVTASPVSVLLHLGVNIDPEGAPVPAIGLKELGLDDSSVARTLLERFSLEWEGIHRACTKVRPVV